MPTKIFSDPARVRPRFRPFKAMKHFRNLIADKEDTSQVFQIFESLPRRSFVDEAKAFVESEKGRALLVSEPYLPTILDDHAALRKLPANSVAHAYVNFMESEGLTAAGLVAEYDSAFGNRPRYDDLIEWYGSRNRDTHDLLHVLTGYGRDPLGEQCVLGFTYSQNKSLANLFIAYAGGYEIKRRVKKGAPVLSAVREGQRLGRLSKRIAEEDIRALLAEPLDAARARLGVTEAKLYKRAHEIYRAQGIDPYDFLGGAVAA